MKFSRIFRETARFWPSSIDISDGELREGGGGYFPKLSKHCANAEDYAAHWSDWHQVMVWAIFCGLHRKAVHSFKAGEKTIRRDEIDKAYVEFKFSESIFSNEPSYPRQFRKSYVNDLSMVKSA